MNLAQYKKPSIFLIFLAALILCFGLLMAFLLHDAAKDLKGDARMINEAGIIRGSIQRLTKLVLAGATQSSDEVITEINRLMANFLSLEKESRGYELEAIFFQGIQSLNKKWLTLEGLLIKYQKTQSEQLRPKILTESEETWDAAIIVVRIAQHVTEDKVKNVRNVFFLILALIVVDTMLVIVFVYLYVKKKLEFENAHDPLTALFNRRSYDSLITPEVARSKRYNSPISLILFDIDHFKKINDTYGHKVGDQVLITLSKVVSESVREADSVCRVGGEEFAIISPETQTEDAFKLAEKIRHRIANYDFKPCKQLTISLGISGAYREMTKDDLYKHADDALYLAKNAGRNCTEVFIKNPPKNTDRSTAVIRT